MNYLVLLLTSLIGTACAQGPAEKQEIKTLSASISPGEVRLVNFPLSNVNSILICRDKEVKYVKKGMEGHALVMESYFSDLSPFSCRVETQGVIDYEITFTVQDKEYKAEQLRVDSKKIKLSPKAEARVVAEQKVLNKIYASSIPDFLFAESFMAPLNSHITSVYGTKRVYNKRKKGQHLGTDFRAAIGDKVPAANAGKVVFAGDLFFTGWTVIIDHGLDIFTVYGHLSKPLVKAGEFVKRGDLIALSGNTGRTSGPHLHWGVKVQGQYIDGFVLIDETKKYFEK